MNRWDLEETRNHIRRIFGDDQLSLAKPSLGSVVDRQIYARIHFRDAKARTKTYADEALQDTSLFEVMFCDSEAWAEYNCYIREIAAHLTAFVQSLHAIPDILAHAVYYSLGLNLAENILKPRDIKASTVLKLLKNEPKLEAIANIFDSLIHAESHIYLAALSNQAKHRSVVSPSLSEDFTGTRTEKHMVVFPAFCHGETSYPQVFADEFLAMEYERISRCVVDIGVEINAFLENTHAP